MLQIGQTDEPIAEEWEGEVVVFDEWHEGVLRAERPAERAVWRTGTGERDRSWLWLCKNVFARLVQRDWLYISCEWMH